MWKRFFLDSNLVFDFADTPEKWNKMVQDYVNLDGCTTLEAKTRLLNARERREDYLGNGVKPETPNFGLYREHTGERTLRQFFEENGMEQ